MTENFRAILVTKEGDDKQAPQKAQLTTITIDDLMAGDVVVAVEYSTVNYKDGLVLSGTSPIIRRFPMIPGIDLAGTVESSENDNFKAGDRVLVNGWGLGEGHYGGFAQRARVKADWLIKVPEALTTSQAMAIGTAGYTAMLCILELERHGLSSDDGPVLVTGAAGGVGSVAIALLARLGFRVIASTGRMSEADYLKSLGASEIIERSELSEKGRPLDKQRWAGAVDSVGSMTLANVLARTRYGGVVAACGLAGGSDLPTTVMPFILRNVTLAGVDSVMAPKQKREQAWRRLARDLDLNKLAALSRTIGLEDTFDAAKDILAGKIRGRTIVDVNA